MASVPTSQVTVPKSPSGKSGAIAFREMIAGRDLPQRRIRILSEQATAGRRQCGQETKDLCVSFLESRRRYAWNEPRANGGSTRGASYGHLEAGVLDEDPKRMI
jgi:hypothetical protein